MRIALASALVATLSLGGCFNDVTNETGGGTNAGTGDLECEGAVGCGCYPNGTCDATLSCFAEAQVCIPANCTPIVAGCPCPAEGCGEGLVCEGPVCVAPGTTSTSTSSTGPSGTTTSGSESTGMSSAADSTGAFERSITLYFSSQQTPFQSAAPVDPRVQADALCAAVRPLASADCLNSVALISVSASDSVNSLDESAGLPFSVPVYNAAGGIVGSSIQDMLTKTNGVEGTLAGLGVDYADNAGNTPAFFWTGSGLMGEFHPSCEEWTVLTDTGKGVAPNIAGQYWLSGNDFPCEEPAPVLCACWN